MLGAPGGEHAPVARILELLGVDLGAAETAAGPEADGDPRGKAIADLNEGILEVLGDRAERGASWPPADGRERDPARESLHRSAEATAQRAFAGRSLWGWADTSTCLTLPFWQRLLPTLPQVESRLRYVICVSHPLEVAAAIEEADGVQRGEGVRLWLHHMSAAFLNTEGCPRIFVRCASRPLDRTDQVGHLARFLSLSVPDRSRRAEIAQQAGHEPAGEAGGSRMRLDATGLPPAVEDLYLRLAGLCGPAAEGSGAGRAEAFAEDS